MPEPRAPSDARAEACPFVVRPRAAAVFFTVDLAFLGANLTKTEHGGWFPLSVGAIIFVVLSTWRRGTKEIRESRVEAEGSLHALKGDRAEQELAEDTAALSALGVTHSWITRFGAGLVEPETVVLSMSPGQLVPVPRHPRDRSPRGRRGRAHRPG